MKIPSLLHALLLFKVIPKMKKLRRGSSVPTTQLRQRTIRIPRALDEAIDMAASRLSRPYVTLAIDALEQVDWDGLARNANDASVVRQFLRHKSP